MPKQKLKVGGSFVDLAPTSGADNRAIVPGGVAAGDVSWIANAVVQGNSSTGTVNKPTGTASGDTLVAYILALTDTDPTPPAGFSLVARLISGADSSLFIFAKQAGGSEPSTYSFGFSPSTFHQIFLETYRNADATLVTANLVYGNSIGDLAIPAGAVDSVYSANDQSQTDQGGPSGYTNRGFDLGTYAGGIWTKAYAVAAQSGNLTCFRGVYTAHVVVRKPEQTAHTLGLTNAGKVVEMQASSASTVTIPNDSSVNFPDGSLVYVRRVGNGTVTVQPAAGVTLNPSSSVVLNQYEEVLLQKRGPNIWSADDVTMQADLDAVVAALSAIGQNNQTASYTLVLSDAGKVVELNNAAALNLTIPLNSSVAFPIGTVIELWQQGAGQVTIVPTAGVTLRSPGGLTKLYGQYSGGTLRKRATDEWVLQGDLA